MPVLSLRTEIKNHPYDVSLIIAKICSLVNVDKKKTKGVTLGFLEK